jgi:hypothetical protein
MKNPDSMKEKEVMTAEQAEEVYARCFKFENISNASNSIINAAKAQELKAFKASFEQLAPSNNRFKKKNLGGRFLKIDDSDPPVYMQTRK